MRFEKERDRLADEVGAGYAWLFADAVKQSQMFFRDVGQNALADFYPVRG